MRRGVMVVVFLSAGVVGAATFVYLGPRGASDGQAAADGRVVYAEHCASCHGVNLEGQPNWQQPLPDGGLPAPPHDATGHTWHHPDALLFSIVKFGGASVASPGFVSNMPGFEGALSDDEIHAALEFIKRQWPADIRARQQRISEGR